MLTALLTSCVQLSNGISATSLKQEELSSHAVLLDFQPVAQGSEYDCGLAAVSAVAMHYRQPIDEATRTRLRQLAAEHESLTALELRQALESAGFDAFVVKGTLGEEVTGIPWQLTAGRPCIVLVKGEVGQALPAWSHFLVIIGHDPERRMVIAADAQTGPVCIAQDDFARLWENAGNVMLIAAPKAR